MSTQLTDILDGVYYKELKGSNVVEAELNRVTAVRVFRVAWGDRLTFTRKMLGEITLGSDGSTTVNPPKSHPELSGLLAARARIEPYHEASRIVSKTTAADFDDPIEYDFAKVTVTYDVSSGQFDTGEPGSPLTLITEEVGITAESINLNGTKFYWTGTTTPVPEATIRIMTGMVEDSIVFHRAATNKRTTVKALVGSVNSATFADSPAGSVLFMGAQSRRSITTDGVQFWELKYSFRTRVLSEVSTQQDSWQKIWKQGAGWTKVVRQGEASKSIYAYGDFSALFT